MLYESDGENCLFYTSYESNRYNRSISLAFELSRLWRIAIEEAFICKVDSI